MVMTTRNTIFKQSKFEIDTDNPVPIHFERTHTGFTGELRFVDEDLMEDALDYIGIKLVDVVY